MVQLTFQEVDWVVFVQDLVVDQGAQGQVHDFVVDQGGQKQVHDSIWIVVLVVGLDSSLALVQDILGRGKGQVLVGTVGLCEKEICVNEKEHLLI